MDQKENMNKEDVQEQLTCVDLNALWRKDQS